MKIFSYLAWIPLALWVAINIYVSQFDGWGAWAAAPLLLFPLAASLIFGLIGLGLFAVLRKDERRSFRTAGVVILPWIPILHVMVSNLLRRF